MAHVFISYVRENQKEVDRLCGELTKHSINIWLDRNDIMPGTRWRQAIREAIRGGAFFIACFSKEYNKRGKTYMNEELNLAISELRQRPADRIWFIPLLLSECEIPDLPLSQVETLRDIQRVPFYEDWDAGIQQILKVIQPVPFPIEGILERTNQLIRDLQELTKPKHPDKYIWYSGFMSAFAVSEEELFPSDELRCALRKEREILLELANEHDCTINCIITPSNPAFEPMSDPCGALSRHEKLLDFLKSGDKALENIAWVRCPRKQVNRYIIGQISCMTGEKVGIERGYNVTYRYTNRDEIDSYRGTCCGIFKDYKEPTLRELSDEERGSIHSENEALRRAMERIVEKSIDYIKQKIGISRGVLVWEPYKALSSKDSQIRICAAYSLANIDDLFAVPTPAAPILVKALRNEDFRVHKLDASAHKLATFALRKIGTPEALKAVEEYEKRKD